MANKLKYDGLTAKHVFRAELGIRQQSGDLFPELSREIDCDNLSRVSRISGRILE